MQKQLTICLPLLLLDSCLLSDLFQILQIKMGNEIRIFSINATHSFSDPYLIKMVLT